MIGRLARVAMVAGPEAGLAVERWKAAVEITPLDPRMHDVGARPLQVFFALQSLRRDAGLIALAATGAAGEFVPQLFAVRKIETREAELFGDGGDDLPIGPGGAGRLDELLAERDHSLAVGAGPLF